MDCFQDCCLYCDRDSPDGAYCSQQCKLADHERAASLSNRNESSPTSPALSQWYSSQAILDAGRTQSTYFSSTATPSSLERTSTNDRQLSPSSSRTSLSSTMSSSPGSAGAMTSQAKQDLHGYFSSFDQARAAKRRSSTR